MLNKVKEKLKDGNVVIGSVVATASPDIVEIMSLAGFDYLMIDTEHGPMSIETITHQIRAAEVRGATPFVRVTENHASVILRTLDVGAYGIHVPQINTREQAEKMVQAAKYYPLGDRGSAMPRSSGYGMLDRREYFKKANEETMLIPHIENIKGIENLKEIVQVKGIDVLFIGPNDLSQSLGISGQLDHPKMKDAINRVLEISSESGITPGIFVTNIEDALKRIEQGFKYILYSMDILLLGKIAKSELLELKKGDSWL